MNAACTLAPDVLVSDNPDTVLLFAEDNVDQDIVTRNG